VRVKLIRAKSIFTKTKISGLDWTINQYVGCQHACLYCYAKSLCKRSEKWGSWVEVKINAPDLVRGKYVRGWVFMSMVSDPYQPLERKFKLTQSVLKAMNKRVRLSILTKSKLVVRDIDLFKEFERIEVGLTVNGFEGGIRRILEPYASSHSERIDALRELKDVGISTYCFISPVIPKLVDVESVIDETSDFVDYYIVEFLNVRSAGREFVEVLRDRFPESYEVLTSRDKLENEVKRLKEICKKFGIEDLILH
jgi:DNA repair photolyase